MPGGISQNQDMSSAQQINVRQVSSSSGPEAPMNAMAVSYTHLEKKCIMFSTHGQRDVKFMCREHDTFFLVVDTVSYTHLDVYKRQPHSSL